MNRSLLFLALLLLNLSLQAQDSLPDSKEIKINEYVTGTLLLPPEGKTEVLVIMIPGSGPTDRNGNQAFMKNDAFKKLAVGLAERDVATFRYDKRILQMQRLGIKEEDIRFDDFITDAVSVIDHFKQQERFEEIIVLGHSQGSLVGMVGAKDRAAAFISLAGPAEPIDSVITEQVATQMPGLKENVEQTFAEIRETGSSTNYNPILEAIFRPSVQPFIASWMKFNPQEELQELDMPILLVNGDKDLQVYPDSAEKLKKVKPDAELVILEGMNHVLTKIEGDALENSKSYNEATRPLHPELIPVLIKFIDSVE